MKCWRRERALINAQFRMIRREQSELAAIARGGSGEAEAALRREAQTLVISLIRQAVWRSS